MKNSETVVSPEQYDQAGKGKEMTQIFLKIRSTATAKNKVYATSGQRRPAASEVELQLKLSELLF